jgi:serine O-acetyltransferase
VSGSNPPRPFSGKDDSVLGYDLVRLLAIAAVTLQHVFASVGFKTGYAFHYLDFGQGGVALFCTLSGFLAGRPSGERPDRWLARRLERIYVPYWICLSGLLAANAVVRYKPMSARLIAGQVLGVAGVLSSAELVGVHFWFITLILTCYGIAALIRWEERLLIPWIVGLVLVPLDPGMKGHLLAFLSGMVVGRSSRPALATAAGAGVWMAGAVTVEPLYAFPMVGTLALLGGTLLSGQSPRAVALASEGTYEFFLVHSPILLAVSKLGGRTWPLTLAVGLPLSLAAAWVLRSTVRAVRRLAAQALVAPGEPALAGVPATNGAAAGDGRNHVHPHPQGGIDMPGLLRTILGDLRRKARWVYGSEGTAAVLKVLLTDGTLAMILYRLMQWSRRYRLAPLELFFNKLNALVCRCIIGRGAEFGPGLVLVHSDGVFINGGVRGGVDVTVYHQVTVGGERGRVPVLGDRVVLSAGAKVVGPFMIGEGARVAPNSVVMRNVPPHTTVMGIPAYPIWQSRSTPEAPAPSVVTADA